MITLGVVSCESAALQSEISTGETSTVSVLPPVAFCVFFLSKTKKTSVWPYRTLQADKMIHTDWHWVNLADPPPPQIPSDNLHSGVECRLER